LNCRNEGRDSTRGEPPLIFWLMRLRAESEKQELEAQVRSFCAFADNCSYISRIECSKCLRYYLRVESASKVLAR